MHGWHTQDCQCASCERQRDRAHRQAVTAQPLGETPIQLTRSLVFFAALRAATDEGFCRKEALKFARDCATAEYEQVVRFASRIAIRARKIAEA